MIKKLKNKIKKVGFFGTVKLIFDKVKIFLHIEFTFLYRKKNFTNNEWKKYWKAYNYIKHKYLKKVINLEKKTGTGTYSNKVWWCWLQGEENCPALQKECLKSIRKNLHDRDIIIITNDNLYEYIELPDYIKDKHKKGIISDTHFSDLIRLELLIKYGGTWIDSTAYCTGYDKELFDKPLFVYKNLNNLWFSNKHSFDEEPIIADNWFITSEIGNPILIAVRDLLFDYWKRYNYLVDYFIFHYFFTLVVNYKYRTEFDSIILKSHLVPHLLQYECFKEYDKTKINMIICESPFHKLTHKVDINSISDNCFYNILVNHRLDK